MLDLYVEWSCLNFTDVENICEGTCGYQKQCVEQLIQTEGHSYSFYFLICNCK